MSGATFPSLSPAGERRQARLVDARLWVVVATRSQPGDLRPLLEAVCAASADVVLLREHRATEDDLRRAADTCRTVCDHAGALFVLDGLPGLAVQVGADGVHLGQRDVQPDHARRIVGPDVLVGRGTSTPGEVDRAADEDVDYFAVGARGGEGVVRYAAARAASPWVAEAAPRESHAALLEAGARRVAVGTDVTEADDPAAACWELRRLLARFPL